MFGQFHPQPNDSSRSGAWRSTILTVLRLALLSAWSFLLALRLLSRKWMRNSDHILCHKREKSFGFSWQCEQDKRVLRISCLRLFKTHFFRVKLQTSLYHPKPLDSKPYKQTNRLENILLSLDTVLLFFFSVLFVYFRFYLFIYIYILSRETFRNVLIYFLKLLHTIVGIQLAGS